jgi:NADPH:quinone reductase-like Zn-dependent oxidoreductase
MTTLTPPAQRMRAISLSAWGDPEVLEEVELERPTPLATEVLVQVHAAGVNPVDAKSRATGGFNLWGEPPVLGYDLSGVVEAVGDGVALFSPGDEVFGLPRFPHQAGTYAEYVASPSRHLVRKPQSLSHKEAAALPMPALTAWQALVEFANLQPGQRVLIHAAGGGVGHLAVQIAKAREAHVIGTASAEKHEALRDLRADELIDYRSVDFTKAVADVDIVLDGVGGDYAERSVQVLRRGGTLLTLPGPVPPEAVAAADKRSVRAAWPIVQPDHQSLLEIAALVDGGKLRPLIDRVFPLAKAADAHAYSELGHTTGKVVLDVAS